jgi:hypothetical protein
MKAKNLIWTQANGTTSTLRELETSHLQNIAAYLTRRQEEYKRFAALHPDRVLPPLTCQGQPVDTWLNTISEILSKRFSKEMIKANALVQLYNKEAEND